MTANSKSSWSPAPAAAEPSPTASNFGLDAPKVVAGLFAVGCVNTFAVGAVLANVGGALDWLRQLPLLVQAVVGVWGLAGVIGGWPFAAWMIYSSRLGKRLERERLLQAITWRGDERILDVGCGRGLLLIGAAHRAPRGRATGLDVWSTTDLHGNGPEALLRNARAEGLEGRVDWVTADARSMPFGDASFDVIVSNLMLHNLPTVAERSRVVDEMVRVLKPGGRLALCDFVSTGDYVDLLERRGCKNVRRTGLRWRMFPPVRQVHATKA